MRFATDAVARATRGRRIGPDVEVDGADIDSRTIRPGQLFVPIVGDRDGHDFIGEALTAGAPAYLTSRAPVLGTSAAATAVAVPDTGRALLALGRVARGRLPDTVVGITGSVGKTTVKDLIAAALRTTFRIAASPRSFNNELGVPLTLVNAPEDVEVTVTELGARGRGQVAELCDVVRPTVGVVIAVALAHTELFGTIDDVAAAKGELVEALPTDGTAVLNADDPRVAAMASRTAARVLRFGRAAGADADVRATDIELDEELRVRFTLVTPWGSTPVRLGIRGEHQVTNALAATAAALAAGVPFGALPAGLAAEAASPWRMHVARTAAGAVVLNDAYNANPASMTAALRSLAALPARRRVAVVGLMAELGTIAEREHRRIAELARSLGIELVVVGTPLYGMPAVADADAAVERLGDLAEGDAVLVKASRVVGLERMAEALAGGGVRQADAVES